MPQSGLTRNQLHARYRKGASPAAVIEACYDRIAAVDDPGVFIHLIPRAEAVAAARSLPPFDPLRYPLWGLPFAIKDNIDLAGAPTTAACREFAFTPTSDAAVVRALIDAGAIPIGKTNLDQFATGLVGVRTPYPAPRNAFDPRRVPGGSSSGSAVATAQGFVTFALGTDTAGSGRIPAALNNLVGLKPSLGALSTWGVTPACRMIDCVSIFATTVEDAQAVFDVAARPDPRDPFSRPLPDGVAAIRRIGLPRPQDVRFFGDEAMAGAWSKAVEHLRALAFDAVEIDLTPFFDVARMLYEGPFVAERVASIGPFLTERRDALHPVTRAILDGAARFNAVDAFRAFHRLAELRARCRVGLEAVDALMVPTAPVFPTLAEVADDPLGPNSRLGTYTNFVNLLDLAAIAVPGPFRGDGLPAGVTFIATAGSDRALCAAGRRFFAGTGGGPIAAQRAAA